MTAKVGERRIDLRNTSIIEVIIVVILVLVIFIFARDLEFSSQEKRYAAIIEDLELQVSKQHTIIKQLQDSLRKAEVELRKLTRENKLLKILASADEREEELLGIVGSLENEVARLRGGGEGKPRCRIENTEVRWLATVDVNNSVVEFKLEPVTNVVKLRNVPGIQELEANSPLTREEFMDFALSTYRWSEAQTPSCRFYVQYKLRQGADVGNLLMVQDYFYTCIRE